MSLSIFPDGFQRTFYTQFIEADAAVVVLARGDTMVQVSFEPGKLGNTVITLPAPLWTGQMVVIVGYGSVWNGEQVDVVAGTAFNQAGNTTVEITGTYQGVVLQGVSGRWQLMSNDGATLS